MRVILTTQAQILNKVIDLYSEYKVEIVWVLIILLLVWILERE